MNVIEFLRLVAAGGAVMFVILAARGFRRAAAVVDEVSHLDASVSMDFGEDES